MKKKTLDGFWLRLGEDQTADKGRETLGS